MTSELAGNEETRDWTKYVWVGIAVLFVGMVGLLWISGRPDPSVSKVRAKHILVKFDANDPTDRSRALELVTDLRERLLNGTNFASLAREYSDDPGSSARGGDLGFYEKGAFAEGFEQHVWKAPLNELSDVVPSVHGFHLIVVTDRYLSEADEYEMELDRRAREELGAPQEPGTPETAPAP